MIPQAVYLIHITPQRSEADKYNAFIGSVRSFLYIAFFIQLIYKLGNARPRAPHGIADITYAHGAAMLRQCINIVKYPYMPRRKTIRQLRKHISQMLRHMK